MPVTLICPHLSCRTMLQVPDSTRGKRVRCGQCGRAFIVPQPAPVIPSPPPPDDEPVPADKVKA